MGTKLMNYEWMTKPTPQEEWIEGGGKTIWLALFFTETGAGLFFVSIFFAAALKGKDDQGEKSQSVSKFSNSFLRHFSLQ